MEGELDLTGGEGDRAAVGSSIDQRLECGCRRSLRRLMRDEQTQAGQQTKSHGDGKGQFENSHAMPFMNARLPIPPIVRELSSAVNA